MNVPVPSNSTRLLRLILFCASAILLAAPIARAGLTMQMQLVHYSYQGYYYYYFFPNLSTNTTPPNIPYGDYFVAPPGFPTNGATAQYHFDTNGFNLVAGGAEGFNYFDAPDFASSFIKSLTVGQWSIFATNTTTNTYHFTVTSHIDSNSLPQVVVTFPAYGATNVTNQPTVTWQGPANYSDLVFYEYDQSPYLPVTDTSFLSSVLYQGINDITIHYDSNSTTAVVCSTPVDAGSHPISSWVSTCQLQTYFDTQFTVGAVDTSGTGHNLVAHYTWDATNADGTASGADSSGNGYNMNFGGSYGAQGGENSTTTAMAGPRAIQFHDGDGNSAGYVGWNPTPAGLLAALAGSFSVSCWVKTTQNYGYDSELAYYGAGIVSADNSGLANDVVPVALTGSKIGFNTGGSTEDITLNSMASINDGNYHHVVVTRNQQTGQKIIYIDGLFDSFSSGTTNLLSDPQKLTIGSLANAADPNANDFNYSNGYDGYLDDLQIYSGVLSSNEVAQLFANPGSTAPNGGGSVPIGVAVDAPQLTWTTSGDTDWYGETTNSYDGVSAAESGAVINSQVSVVQTTVTGPGTLTFYWQTVANPSGNFDLEFAIDGNDTDDSYGMTTWYQDGPFTIPAGTHTLSWTAYAGGDTDPTEEGYLDVVSYVVSTVPIITINPFNQTNYPGYDVALLAGTTSTNGPFTWAWYKTGSGSPIPNATNALYIPTNSGNASVAGNYYAIVSNNGGSATSTTAMVTFVAAPLPPDWSQVFRSQYANNLSDDTTNYNIACLLDSFGNIYTVGSVIGTNTFGTNTLDTSNGVTESAFLKQTATGTPIWGRSMTNNGNGSSFPRGMAAAPGGGFYAIGAFFGTNWLGTNQLVDVAGGSTYVVRMDANGNTLWVRTIVGTNGNFADYHCVVSDLAGNVTVAVAVTSSTSFGTTNVAPPGQLFVIAQYDTNGAVRWMDFPSGWPHYLSYSAGSIYGSMGGGSTNYIAGATNVSALKQAIFSINDANGHGNWVRGIAGQQGSGNPGGLVDDTPCVAASGTNVFVAGTAWGSNATFGPFTVTFPTSKGQYFARYDTNGNAQLATSFGSEYVFVWGIVADASGNVYVDADFDEYAFFGNDLIAAPFYETIQFLVNVVDSVPGQTCVAKFDRNGNALWARRAFSQSSYANTRDLALAPDGVWSCGFFNQQTVFGTNTINGQATCIGSPICTLVFHPAGFMAKVTDSVIVPPITLLNPGTTNGTNFEFSFQSQSGFTYNVESRTNLLLGAWQTNGTISGDGTLKLFLIPKTNAARFFRVEVN